VSYSVDTSALLDAWVRYYPPDVFDTLWKHIDVLIDESRLCVIDEVRRELQKKDDEVYKWIATRSSMIVTLDEAIQERAARIINRFPALTNTKGVMSGSADPFVIALAQRAQSHGGIGRKEKTYKAPNPRCLPGSGCSVYLAG